MKKEEDKNKLAALANRMKTEPVKTPVQETKPIKQKEGKEEEAQLNVNIPKSLNKAIKLYAVTNDVSLKEVVAQALTVFLKKESGWKTMPAQGGYSAELEKGG